MLRQAAMFALLCFLSLAARAWTQTVDLHFQDADLREVFRSLKEQTGMMINFSDEAVERSEHRVTMDRNGVDLRHALDEVLAGAPLTYNIEGRSVTIIPAAQQPPVRRANVAGRVLNPAGRPMMGVAVRLRGTDRGTTTDAGGNFVIANAPLPAQATLSFMGYETQTVQLEAGRVLTFTMKEAVIETQTAVVTGYTVIDKRELTSSITTLNANDLEKIGSLSIDQMLEGKAPGLMVMNVSAQPGAASKLRVRSSGTFTGSREPLWVIDGVVYEDPVPLSAADINSLDRVNLIGNAITGLNPQDIESINILKDASATAIYGTRAANGVIVITTKRGKAGPATVSYAGSFNVSDRPRYSDFNLMNSKERIDVSREIARRGLNYPIVSGPLSYSLLQTPLGYEKALQDYWHNGDFGAFQNEVSRLETLNYDWFGKLYRPAVNHSHSVNVTGGSDDVRYYASVGYDNQQGTERGVNLNRLTARVNMDMTLRPNLTLSLNMDGAVQKADYNRTGESIFSGMPYAFNEAYYTSRAVEASDPEGNLVYIDKIAVSPDNANYSNRFAKYNILHEQDNYSNKIDNKAWNLRAGAQWRPLSWLTYNGYLSWRNTTNLREEYVTEDTYYVARLRGYDTFEDKLESALSRVHTLVPFGGLYSGGNVSQDDYSIRNQLRATHRLKKHHMFTLEVVQEAKSSVYKGATNWQAPGYNHDQGRQFISLPELGILSYTQASIYDYQSMLKWYTDQAGTLSAYPGIVDKTYNQLSWLGILNYAYKNKYIANFNIRSDGSNAFGQYERYKFRPLWSASARWNIHEESFLSDKMWINELALRLSYGFSGRSPREHSPYLVLSNYGHNNPFYDPENTADLVSFPNGNLRWESTSTVNAGLNYSFFENRLFGTVDFAYAHSRDLILLRPVSLVNGIAMQAYNGGKKSSQTIEIDIHGTPIRTRDWRWNLNFNLSHNKERVLTGTNVIAGDISVANYLGVNGQEIIMEGFPVDGFFSYRYGGLDDNGFPVFPGLSGSYDTAFDQLQALLSYQGSKLPIVYGGFGTEVSWKGFTLSSYFSYKLGHKVRLLNLYQSGTNIPLPHQNMRDEFAERWRNPGDDTDIPVLTDEPMLITDVNNLLLPNGAATSLYDLYNLSDLRTAGGDFIRWQSLTLSCRAPRKWLTAVGVKSASLRLQVQNLAVWAFDKKLRGQDPEQVSNVGLPVQTSFSMGLNIGF